MTAKKTKDLYLYGFLVLLSIILVSAIHLAFINVVPDPFFQPDSIGYFQPALNFINNKPLDLSSRRTFGYPGFVLILLALTKKFSVIIILQHGLHILYSALTGWIGFRFIKLPFWAAIFTGLMVCLLPAHIVYAHSILSETSFTCLLILNLWLFFYSLQKNNIIISIAHASLTLLAITFRPAGLALILAFSLGYWTLSPRQNRMKRLVIYSSTCLFLLLSWSTYNLAKNGYFGLLQKNDEILFASAGYLLDVSKVENKEIRNALIPVYDTHRDKIHDVTWMMFNKEGAIQSIKNISSSDKDLRNIMNSLAFQAISRHPIRYGIRLMQQMKNYLLYGSLTPHWFILPKEYFLYKGLKIYWEQTESMPAMRDFLVYKPQAHQSYILQVSRKKVFPYDKEAPLSRVLKPISSAGIWLPSATCLIAFVMLLKPKLPRRNKGITALLLAMILGHLLIQSIGGFDRRYAIPIEPLYPLLFFMGLNNLITCGNQIKCWIIKKTS